MIDDIDQAKHGQRREPEQHDRTEEGADDRRTAFLHEEQQEQDDDGNRDHEGMQRRCANLQPFDS